MKYAKKIFISACMAIMLFGAASASANDFDSSGRKPTFGHGEKLTYSVSYRAAMWPNTDVGSVVLTVTDDQLDGVDSYRLDAVATISGMFKWFYKLNDRYHIWLRKSDMRPVRADANLSEGDYRFTSTYLYDWDSGVSHNTYHNHAHPKASHANVQLVSDAMDAISLFYNLRLNDFSTYVPGESRSLAFLLTDKVQLIKYKFHGREVKKILGLGEVATLKFSCQLVNDSADSFEDGSEFFVWISDDANRIPVLFESPLKVGSIRARLVKYEGLVAPNMPSRRR